MLLLMVLIRRRPLLFKNKTFFRKLLCVKFLFQEKMFLFLKAASRCHEGGFEKAGIDLAELLLKLPDVLDGLEDDLQFVDARLLREGRHD